MLDTGAEQSNILATSLPTENRDNQQMEKARNEHNAHGAGWVLRTSTTSTTQIMPMASAGKMDRTNAQGLEIRPTERKKKLHSGVLPQ